MPRGASIYVAIYLPSQKPFNYDKQDMWDTVKRASVGQPARSYLHQLCADRGCSLEGLLGVMDERDGWEERESGKYVLAA